METIKEIANLIKEVKAIEGVYSPDVTVYENGQCLLSLSKRGEYKSFWLHKFSKEEIVASLKES